MRNFYCKITSTFFISLLFVNCGSIIYKDFNITNFHYTDEYIQIEFSEAINQKSIINAFSFLEDDFLEEGRFSFSQNSITFFPANKIKKNHLYQISISTEAESYNGVSLQNSFSKTFSTKESNLNPAITDFKINTSNIIFNFNSPIDRSSFEKSFSIDPDIKHIEKWSEDFCTVTLEFTERPTNNSIYIIEVTKDLKNIYNNNLESIFNYYYEYNKDKVSATYQILEKLNDKEIKTLTSENQNININTNSFFEIIFDKEIKFDTLNSSIEFIPPINFEIQKNNIDSKKAKILLKEKPVFNSEYKLIINDNLLDTNSNKLEQKEFSLLFNNDLNRNITFLTGAIDLTTEIISFNKNTIYQDITFDVAQFPTISNAENKETQYIYILFIFDISNHSSEINKFSFIENFNINSTQKCISLIPIQTEVISKNIFLQNEKYKSILKSINEQNPELDLVSKNISIIQQKVQVQNYESIGLLKFNIKKTLQDNLGNALQEDVLITFNKN